MNTPANTSLRNLTIRDLDLWQNFHKYSQLDSHKHLTQPSIKKNNTTQKRKKRQLHTENDWYTVEKILNHRSTLQGIEYLVKWEGYPHSENSWIPRDNFSSNKPIKIYLKRVLRKTTPIPKQPVPKHTHHDDIYDSETTA